MQITESGKIYEMCGLSVTVSVYRMIVITNVID